MSLYRYARDSKTSAQREADKWQRKVDEKRALIKALDSKYPHLTTTDLRRLNAAHKSLANLLAENPNEAV